jgi:hypothetical protein
VPFYPSEVSLDVFWLKDESTFNRTATWWHFSLTIIGIGVLWLAFWGTLTRGVYAFQIDSGHGDAAPTTRVPRKAKLKYERIMMGELIDNDATSQGFKTVGSDETKLAFTRFKATDGEILTLPDGEFSSPDEAKRYFDRMMTSGSLKIMKQGKKLNASGKSVGWGAELALGPEKVESKSWTIV